MTAPLRKYDLMRLVGFIDGVPLMQPFCGTNVVGMKQVAYEGGQRLMFPAGCQQQSGLALMKQVGWQGTVPLMFASNCCPEQTSSSGSGSPSSSSSSSVSIITGVCIKEVCTSGISQTLMITVTDEAAECSCLNGQSFVLSYFGSGVTNDCLTAAGFSSVPNVWLATNTLCGQTMELYFICSGGNMAVVMCCNGTWVATTSGFTVTSCSPNFDGSGVMVSGITFCGTCTTAELKFVVTEV